MDDTHRCTLHPPKVQPARKERIRRQLLRFLQISLKHPATKYHFRSLAAVEEERQRQTRITKRLLVHPLSMFRIYWEAIYALVFTIQLFVVPLYTVYTPFISHMTLLEALLRNIKWFCLPIDILNMGDMYVTSITGVIDEKLKIIELSRRGIIFSYLSSKHFYLDLICSCPFFAVFIIYYYFRPFYVDTIINTCLLSFDLLKIVRLFKLKLYFSNTCNLSTRGASFIVLVKCVLISLLVLHWITCFYILQLLIFRMGDGYLRIFSDSKNSIFEFSYAYSYCIIAFINTAAVLGISLTNGYQKSNYYLPTGVDDTIYIACVQVIGYITFNIFLILIIQLMLRVNASEIKYYAIVNQVKKYMLHKALPEQMQKRILVYYEYRYQKKYFSEARIENVLSSYIHRDIVLYSRRNLINNVSILKELDSNVLSEVISNLKHEVFLYNDTIVKAGSPGDCMYFIASGTVAIYTPTGKEICHLEDGAYFGEVALVSRNQKRVATVVAIEICDMFRLEKRLFSSCFPGTSAAYRRLELIALERQEKTVLLEELHMKYMIQNRTKLQAEQTAIISNLTNVTL